MSSSEQWSDDGKREKDDSEEMFYRSKKTRRTPSKDANPKENMLMKKLKDKKETEEMDNLKKEVKAANEEIERLKAENRRKEQQ
ncbi:hypothetical protein QE152_g3982 [Popillia japonica]|uniref:Uncharacterized protein n=1 Tax=Popillia japonica TaxID=7064 RepID=A0AAW1N1Y2_POPJA